MKEYYRCNYQALPQGADGLTIVCFIMQEITGSGQAERFTQATPMTEVVDTLGLSNWLAVYEELEAFYGPSFWEGLQCTTLGDLCARIDAWEVRTGSRRPPARQEPLSRVRKEASSLLDKVVSAVRVLTEDWRQAVE